MKDKSFISRLIRKILVLSCLAVLFLAIMSMTAFRPDNLGIRNGKLSPLPDSPNCVSSQSEDVAKKMPPLEIDSDEPLKAIASVIENEFPGARLVESDGNYMHFEFTSRLFRFVDDVEFFADGDVVHFRSASRVGYSDMGANRKRIATIGQLLDRGTN